MTTCAHCEKSIENDDGTWYHVDTQTARCDGPDDESGLSWGDMVRQAEPNENPTSTSELVRTVTYRTGDSQSARTKTIRAIPEGGQTIDGKPHALFLLPKGTRIAIPTRRVLKIEK